MAIDKVVRLDLGIVPEAAISGAMLFQDDYRAYLAFNAMRPTPDGRREPAGLAIVELQGCGTTKFGYPNDEARPGHPLWNNGLSAGGYGIYEVRNSSWIAEHLRQNRVSFPKTKYTSRSRHFIFTFHESTFECTARNLKVEVQPYSERLQALYGVILAWWQFSHEEDQMRADEDEREMKKTLNEG